jgi:hypothetical protein
VVVTGGAVIVVEVHHERDIAFDALVAAVFDAITSVVIDVTTTVQAEVRLGLLRQSDENLLMAAEMMNSSGDHSVTTLVSAVALLRARAWTDVRRAEDQVCKALLGAELLINHPGADRGRCSALPATREALHNLSAHYLVIREIRS